MVDLTFVQELSLQEGMDVLQSLVIYVLGISIFAIFVFKFYRFLAHKDLFHLKTNEQLLTVSAFFQEIGHLLGHFLKYIFVYPLFVFFWFAIISLFLIVLSDHDVQNILLISMSVVGATRITSFYSEELSKDVAKTVPFALLAVFLTSANLITFSELWETILQLPLLWEVMIYYLLFVVLLELSLRFMYSLFGNKNII